MTQTKIKGKSTLLVILGLLFTLLFNCSVSAAETDRDLLMKDMPESLQQLIIQHEKEGKKITFQAEQNQNDLISTVSSSVTNLPDEGWTANRTFTKANQTLDMGEYYISSACTMKVYMTTTYKHDPANFRLMVYCEDTGKYVHNKTHYVSSGAEDPISVSVTKGYTYTVKVQSTTADTYVVAYVYGE